MTPVNKNAVQERESAVNGAAASPALSGRRHGGESSEEGGSSGGHALAHAELALRDSVEPFASVFHSGVAAIGISRLSDGRFLDVNEAFVRLYGYARSEVVGHTSDELHLWHSPNREAVMRDLRQHQRQQVVEMQARRKDGEIRDLLASLGLVSVHGEPCILGVLTDITDRKRAELETQVQMAFLSEFNQRRTVDDLIGAAVKLVRKYSDCEAVGIRLRAGDDYPYFETHGFPQEFVKLENSLCTRDAAGKALRDADGNVLLDCMCGNVICGRSDPSKSFFTKNGSFWANDTTRLLATTTPADRRAKTRNRCNGEGYESVALVPLVAGGERLGLLQMNDRRKGMFSPEKIALWERVAGYLAVALAKCRADVALSASVATYRSLFENMMNGVAHVRVIFAGDQPADLEYLACNPAFAKVTGLTMPLVGRRVSEVIPGYCENNPESLATFGRVAATGVPEQWEHYLRDLDRWFSFMLYAPTRGEVIIVTENITERKRAEESLRASEATYRSLFENMLNGVAHCRIICEGGLPVDFVYLKVNQAFERLTGLKAVEGKRVSEVIPGIRESDAELLEIYGRVAATGRPEVFERCVQALNMWFHVAVYCPMPGEFVAVFDVITERKQAEEALRESEARFRLLVEAAPEAIYVQTGGRYAYVNQAMIALVGARSAAELLGASSMDRIAPEFHDQIRERNRIQRETGRPSLLAELECVRLDGARVPVESTAVAIRFRGEDGHLVFMRDITVRRNAERERTALEAQLRQAQKMESVGRLAGGVAHDFNNLLMGIMGHADLCRDGLPVGHAIRPWLDEITADAQRSAGITRQLLAFARKQTIAPVYLDLNDHVAGTLKMLRRLIGEDIDLAWMPHARSATVMMDPSQIDQILANLAVNARDAITGVGKLTVKTEDAVFDAAFCGAHTGAIPGKYVLLAVTDTGCGMERSILEHLFEPFFTTKGIGKGTGLGLATVYGIVKQNQGYIDVVSAPGKGASFRVYLPQCGASTTAGVADTKTGGRFGGKESILLVEDEPSVRAIMRAYLDALGYTVLVAEAPEQALRAVADRRQRIDLLITDVVLPGQSGRDLADELKRHHPGLRTIFMSGYTADVIARQGVLEEGVDFLQKPFGRDQIARKVREVLDRR